MAAGYVDDHKLILYRDGAQPRDITAFASRSRISMTVWS